MIPTDRPHIRHAELTHPGMSGKNNEDRLIVTSYRMGDQASTPVTFAMVADGVGGKQAGELAAEIAVEKFIAAVAASDGGDPAGTMRKAVLDANEAIRDRAAEAMETQGMGTTVTAAWIAGNRLYAINVGNSRLYLFRDGILRRISIDHSWVQEALDHGILTPEQARNHPNARIITRHLGSESVEPDLRLQLSPEETDDEMLANQGMPLQPDDILLLCSDGLSDVVEDAEIATALAQHDLGDALQQLTDLANARGGPDNITSIALCMQEPEKAAGASGDGRARGSAVRLSVYLLSIVVLVTLILAGWLVLEFLK